MAHFLEEAPTAPKHKPTEEQQEIIDVAISSKDNLLIDALAGAAKTSTLVMVANTPDMQSVPTLSLAFNKKIADEMRTRLPSNCVSMTLNSLGHRMWGQAIGKRLNLDTKKNYNILKGLIDDMPKALQDTMWDNYSDIARVFGHAKSSGWIPDYCSRNNNRLLDDQSFFDSLDEQLTEQEESLLINAMLKNVEMSFEGTIDFDDQILMSTCFPIAKAAPFPLTMVDEAQDLSGLNHQMLAKIVQSKRLFAVGDPCQAIYAFRGAYGDSMDRLQQKFSMTRLQLSTSFRCPKAVVEEAHWRAPHMKAPDWAIDGEVTTWTEWSADKLPQDAVIVCRNNAPIFSMAIKLLRNGRYPQIVGNDIGKTLLKALEKLGPADMSQEEALKEWETYRLRRLSKARAHAVASVEDFCTCLRIFIERGETLGGAIAYANHIMNATGPIKMMTGHKSKGLEFHNVFILDRQLLRISQDGQTQSGKNQDHNLLYVMQTRAQRVLTYITTEGFVTSEPEEG